MLESVDYVESDEARRSPATYGTRACGAPRTWNLELPQVSDTRLWTLSARWCAIRNR